MRDSAHGRTHASTHARTLVRTHARTHARTHTRTHTHTLHTHAAHTHCTHTLHTHCARTHTRARAPTPTHAYTVRAQTSFRALHCLRCHGLPTTKPSYKVSDKHCHLLIRLKYTFYMSRFHRYTRYLLRSHIDACYILSIRRSTYHLVISLRDTCFVYT